MTLYTWDWNPKTLTVRLAPQAVTLDETMAAMDDQQTTHARLIAAGWEWDGMDGYTAPDVAAWRAEHPPMTEAPDWLPPLVSNPAVVLEPKGVPKAESGPSFLFATGDPDAVLPADDDRRFFIYESAADSYRKGDASRPRVVGKPPELAAPYGAYTPEDADPFMTPATLRRALVVGAIVVVACAAIAGWLTVLGA